MDVLGAIGIIILGSICLGRHSPKKFRAFCDTLLDTLPGDVEAEIDRKAGILVKSHPEQYGSLSKTELNRVAMEEVVAECCETMLTDTDAAKRISRLLYEKDQSLWNRVKEFFADLSRKLKKAYRGYDPDSYIAREAKKTIQKMDGLVELWAEMAVEGAENYRGEGRNLSVINGDGVKYSDRTKTTLTNDRVQDRKDKKRITISMTDSERTEILNGKVITAAVYEGQADKSIEVEMDNLKSYRDNIVKAALARIGEEFGVFTDYRISDVELDIRLSKSNLKESISKKVDAVQIAKLLPIMESVIQNAVGLECHANRYFYDNNTVMFENLLGGYVDGVYFHPIRFGLKHARTGNATLYLIVDQQKIDIKKTKAEVTKVSEMQDANANTSRSAFDISLSSIIPFVNGKDMLRYIPDNMLNEKQKTDKWEAIAETIQYSNDKNDRKYADFIRKGNLVAAKRMIDSAAEAAGYKKGFFHGSKKGGGFTRFRDWQYFTQNKKYAERYAIRDNPGSLYSVYVKMDNPFDTRNNDAREVFYEVRQELGLGELQENGLPDWTDGYDLSDYIEENDLDYDGIILDEGGDLVDGKPVSRGLSYVIRKSNQVKSADVITYDDEGNIIPISQRFNPENPDIRFSDRVRSEKQLTRENEKLKADVENLRELLKLQGTVTGGNVFTADSLKTSANFILRETGMQLDADGKKTFEKLLGDAYGSLVGMDSESVTLEDILDTCSDAAEWLHSNSDDLEGDPLRKLDVNDMMVVIYDSLWKSMNLVL